MLGGTTSKWAAPRAPVLSVTLEEIRQPAALDITLPLRKMRECPFSRDLTKAYVGFKF